MYTDPAFKHKKELLAAVKRGEKIRVYAPAFRPVPDGQHSVEGPANKPHTWYATVIVKDKYIKKVIT